jgi:hypothetical protein
VGAQAHKGGIARGSTAVTADEPRARKAVGHTLVVLSFAPWGGALALAFLDPDPVHLALTVPALLALSWLMFLAGTLLAGRRLLAKWPRPFWRRTPRDPEAHR